MSKKLINFNDRNKNKKRKKERRETEDAKSYFISPSFLATTKKSTLTLLA